MDYLTANWLMPLGGLGTVLFTGWVLRRELVHEAVGIGRPGWFSLWWNLLRYGTRWHRAGLSQPHRARLRRAPGWVLDATEGALLS